MTRGPLVYNVEQKDRDAADVIVAVDGAAGESASAFVEKIEEHRPGDQIVLTILRDGRDDRRCRSRLGSTSTERVHREFDDVKCSILILSSFTHSSYLNTYFSIGTEFFLRPVCGSESPVDGSAIIALKSREIVAICSLSLPNAHGRLSAHAFCVFGKLTASFPLDLTASLGSFDGARQVHELHNCW